jgi:hypothetical protein
VLEGSAQVNPLIKLRTILARTLQRPPRPQDPPPHVHVWRDPWVDEMKHTSIEFALCGQHCECGARRMYRGPAYGWENISDFAPTVNCRD